RPGANGQDAAEAGAGELLLGPDLDCDAVLGGHLARDIGEPLRRFAYRRGVSEVSGDRHGPRDDSGLVDTAGHSASWRWLRRVVGTPGCHQPTHHGLRLTVRPRR